MYRKSVWGFFPIFPSHLPIPCAFCCEAPPIQGVCTHDLLPASLTNSERAAGILSTFTESAGQKFNISFLTVFRIFFLYCLFFVYDVLQELLNGITLPVEVANREPVLFLHLHLCSLRSSCDRHRQGEQFPQLILMLLCDLDILHSHLNEIIQIFKNCISPFQARWSLERYYNAYYTIIVMILILLLLLSACQGLIFWLF